MDLSGRVAPPYNASSCNPEAPNPVLPRLAVLLQTLIAAGTFLVAKDATERFGSLPLIWLRIVLSALIMGAFFAVRFRSVPRLARADWLRLVLLGLLGVSVNQGLFLYGIHFTSPLHASLLYAFTPVLVLLGAVLWIGERLTWLRSVAVACAAVGVFLVLSSRGLDLSRGPLRGDLFVLVAVVAWSSFTLLGKSIIRRLGTVTVITGAFAFGALSVVPLGPWMLGGFDPSAPGFRGWLELLYLGGITSGVAFTLWYWALKHIEPSQVAIFTNLQAPFTALFAWMIFGTIPGTGSILGGLLVLFGVSLAQLPARRNSVPHRAAAPSTSGG